MLYGDTTHLISRHPSSEAGLNARLMLSCFSHVCLSVVSRVFSPLCRVDGFEFTPEVGLFDLVGVSLYHGWLADPQQRETHQVVAQTSYNQLVSMAIGGAEETDQDGGSSEYQAKGGPGLCVLLPLVTINGPL